MRWLSRLRNSVCFSGVLALAVLAPLAALADDCPQPDPPQVVSGSALAQEAVLSAVVPDGMTATSVWWRAEWERGPSDIVTLWEHESVENEPYQGGETVYFGAPGLVVNATHYFRVLFCNDQIDPCDCWSDQSAPVLTTGFSNFGPAPPATLTQLLEDQFERPETHLKCSTTPGDGMGPWSVWVDCDPGWPGHGGRIAASEEEARMTVTSLFKHLGTADLAQQWDPDSYTDIYVRVELESQAAATFLGKPQGFKYNLQAQTRIFEVSGVDKSFAAKLIKGARGCTKPTLFLVKLPDEYNSALCVNGKPDPEVGTICRKNPPLDEPAGDGRSEPAWLRVEAYDSATPDWVTLHATVAWGDCTDGGDISLCDETCTFERDMYDPELYGESGTWGASFHEKTYLVDLFRGGSADLP